MITFEVNMRPVGKGRPRMGRWGVFTPQATVDAEKRVREAAKAVMTGPLMEGPVTVVVFASFAVPASYSKAKREAALRMSFVPSKPDTDNIAKLVMDAMNGVVYSDDSQCAILVSGKRYGQDGAIWVSVCGLHEAPPLPPDWVTIASTIPTAVQYR